MRFDIFVHLDSSTDIAATLMRLEGKIDQLAATVVDLDTALTAFEAANTAATTEIQAAVAAIVAKVGPGVDLTPEIARLTAASTSLQTAADAIKAQAGP